MRAALTLLLSFLACSAATADLRLAVRLDADRRDALVERVLDWRAFGLHPRRVRVEENGRPISAQADADRVLFRLPGLTRAGVARHVHLRPGMPAPASRGGLRVTEEGGSVRVDNGVYAIVHDPARSGGLPARFTFHHTGRTDASFVLNDRVYDQTARRGYALHGDKAPRIRVVSRGPLVAVVEVSARYLAEDGSAPESQPRATYRFRYAAGSPVVQIEARMEQRFPFSWSELHFLELNTHELAFPHWMTGSPDASGTFTNAMESSPGRWGALYNDREALGLSAGQVIVYDGYQGHGNYLHGDWVGWSTTCWYCSARLYLGTADQGLASVRHELTRSREGAVVAFALPELERRLHSCAHRLARARGSRGVLARWHLAQARASLVSEPSPGRARAELARAESLAVGSRTEDRVTTEVTPTSLCVANAGITLAFERRGGAVFLRSLYDAVRGREFARKGPEVPGLWRLTFRPADFSAANGVSVEPGTAPCHWQPVRTREGVEVRLVWKGLAVGTQRDAADVTVTVRVPAAGSMTDWRIAVANRSRQQGLWEVTFPRLANLTVPRTGALVVPMGWGQLYRDPTRTGHYDGDYPNGWATAQLASLYDGGHALYLAAHDGQARHKRLVFRPQPESDTLSYEVVQYPDDMAAPGRAYTSPYAVVVGTHAGDWFDAAKLYRAWAARHSIWFPRQPLSANRDVPEWLKRNPLWCCTGGDPTDVVKRVTEFRSFFRVPMGLHWYVWHQIPFDDHYPEYFPPKVGFKEAVAQIKALGVRVMPYINGRLFDSRTDTWRDDSAEKYCALSDRGEKYTEVYGSSPPLSPMCPATPYWQGKIAGIVERLVGEFGVNGVYIDQIGAAGTALCFNREHPHGAGGAASWVPGYRELLRQTRQRMRAADPQSFLTTEDAAEPYQGGIDAFLMCNQTRGGLVPLYPAIYAGRTLTFGRYLFESDAKASLPMITKLAEMFVFGAQLGWIDAFILNYRKEAEYLKRLAETRLAATSYLALGEMLRPPVLQPDAPPVKTTWELWGSRYPIEFPAVLGSAWRADDGTVALVVTNITERPVRFRWRHSGRSGSAVLEGLSAAVVPVRRR